jgi:hypothetical protein
MSEIIMIILIPSSISVIGTLLGAFFTKVFNMRNENLKEKKERKKENLGTKEKS